MGYIAMCSLEVYMVVKWFWSETGFRFRPCWCDMGYVITLEVTESRFQLHEF